MRVYLIFPLPLVCVNRCSRWVATKKKLLWASSCSWKKSKGSTISPHWLTAKMDARDATVVWFFALGRRIAASYILFCFFVPAVSMCTELCVICWSCRHVSYILKLPAILVFFPHFDLRYCATITISNTGKCYDCVGLSICLCLYNNVELQRIQVKHTLS